MTVIKTERQALELKNAKNFWFCASLSLKTGLPANCTGRCKKTEEAESKSQIRYLYYLAFWSWLLGGTFFALY
ncbi:MAG TPA: hypothetical protein DCZ88_14725 [Pseudanabaena sp.]|nr:hypothetical protein [Pseudanabaena sp.]